MKVITALLILYSLSFKSYSQDLKFYINKVIISEKYALPDEERKELLNRNWIIVINNSKKIVSFNLGDDGPLIAHPIYSITKEISDFSGRTIHKVFFKKKSGKIEHFDYIIHEDGETGSAMFYADDKQYQVIIYQIEPLND